LFYSIRLWYTYIHSSDRPLGPWASWAEYMNIFILHLTTIHPSPNKN
jgi:hypothetical protein